MKLTAVFSQLDQAVKTDNVKEFVQLYSNLQSYSQRNIQRSFKDACKCNAIQILQ